jgi:hypothetical protein
LRVAKELWRFDLSNPATITLNADGTVRALKPSEVVVSPPKPREVAPEEWERLRAQFQRRVGHPMRRARSH